MDESFIIFKGIEMSEETKANKKMKRRRKKTTRIGA